MASKIQVKRGNKADLPILSDGEYGFCQDTSEIFIGNGGTNTKIYPTTSLDASSVTVEDIESMFESVNVEGVLSELGESILDILNGVTTVGKASDANTVGGFTVAKNVPSNADFTDTVYTHPTTAGNKHIPTGGSVGQILKNTASGTATWQDESDLVAHKTARFVIGTSTAGWTTADCDYLCDGTADQVEINNAITALPATGGEIVILDGTYNIAAKIDVTKDNVSIRGNGNATILKRMFDSSVPEGVITLTSRSGCKIADLQVDGNKTSYTDSNLGIFLYDSSNNTVTGNTCNNNDYSIFLYDSSNNTVTGNTCNNNDYSISLESSSNNTVTGNTCSSNEVGIFLQSSNNNTVTGNTCNNNDYGIHLHKSNNNTVTGNTCYNNSYGINLYDSNNNTITGNTCIRGTGLSGDYTADQYTIRLHGTNNSFNLIAMNNCMGQAVTNEGGTGNSVYGNKYDSGDYKDFTQDEKTKLEGISDTSNLMPISGGVLENYSEKLVTLSGTSTAINLSLGNVFTHTLTGNTTYSITNAVNGQAHSFTLIITQTGIVRTITFPASVKWQGGEIPDMTTASKTYVLTFMTVDGGTNWLGMFGGEF